MDENEKIDCILITESSPLGCTKETASQGLSFQEFLNHEKLVGGVGKAFLTSRLVYRILESTNECVNNVVLNWIDIK